MSLLARLMSLLAGRPRLDNCKSCQATAGSKSGCGTDDHQQRLPSVTQAGKSISLPESDRKGTVVRSTNIISQITVHGSICANTRDHKECWASVIFWTVAH